MPVEIDYSKRTLSENLFDPGAWRNLLGGIGSVAGDVATTWEQIEKVEGSKPLVTEPPPYQPKLALADFKFTPNVKLIALGCGLLVVAWILKKK